MTYRCVRASISQMEEKWNTEIADHQNDPIWINWKAEFIEAQVNGERCSYYGILNGKIITEATAAFSPKGIQNADGLISNQRAYVMAFRTVAEEEGKGYFSQLFQFMLSDLKKRGYQEVTLGVEPTEKRNNAIYKKWGFNKHFKTAIEYYGNDLKNGVEVNYYLKEIES